MVQDGAMVGWGCAEQVMPGTWMSHAWTGHGWAHRTQCLRRVQRGGFERGTDADDLREALDRRVHRDRLPAHQRARQRGWAKVGAK